MKTITRRDLVESISQRTGVKRTEVLSIIDTLLEEIVGSLSSSHKIVMRNFGVFYVQETKAKVGRNPKSPDKPIPIPSRHIVRFKAGKNLREKVLAIKKED